VKLTTITHRALSWAGV